MRKTLLAAAAALTITLIASLNFVPDASSQIAAKTFEQLTVGNRFVVSTKTNMSNLITNTQFTITRLAGNTVTFDEHDTATTVSGSGSKPNASPADQKGKTFTIEPFHKLANADAPMTIDVNSPVFRGKVKVLHNQTAKNGETWKSVDPIDAEFTLGDGSKLKTKAIYIKNNIRNQNGHLYTIELFVLAPFPMIDIWTTSDADVGNGEHLQSEQILQSLN